MATVVSIIGLGLLGGSLGMALRQNKYQVVGWDRDPEATALALELGAIDRAADSIEQAAAAATVAVVVATPVMAVRDVFQAIASHVFPGTVVTDVASTKRQVTAWARELLSEETPFVGGHPMAGLEVAGVRHARADLFEGAVYCVMDEPDTPHWARHRIELLAGAARARTVKMEADMHDHLVAGISHLPLVAAAALVQTTSRNPAWELMAQLAATGYRDTTRLASGDPVMQRDICVTNADELRAQLLALSETLKQAASLLDDPEAIGSWLGEAKAARDAWLDASTKFRRAERS